MTHSIRVGSHSREASQEALARLVQQRGALRIETQPVGGSSFADLDRPRLDDYFVRVRKQEVPADSDDNEWQRLLRNTEFLADDAPDAACTVAGLLLFGVRPERFLPQSGIDCAAYAGVAKDYAVIERETVRGPLPGLFSPRGNPIPVDPGQV